MQIVIHEGKSEVDLGKVELDMSKIRENKDSTRVKIEPENDEFSIEL